jgi:hypothetical protein
METAPSAGRALGLDPPTVVDDNATDGSFLPGSAPPESPGREVAELVSPDLTL